EVRISEVDARRVVGPIMNVMRWPPSPGPLLADVLAVERDPARRQPHGGSALGAAARRVGADVLADRAERDGDDVREDLAAEAVELADDQRAAGGTLGIEARRRAALPVGDR